MGGGSLDADLRTSGADLRTFWCKKNFGFFKIYGVFARTTSGRALSQYGHFSDKGSVYFFAILFGRLSWTAP